MFIINTANVTLRLDNKLFQYLHFHLALILQIVFVLYVFRIDIEPLFNRNVVRRVAIGYLIVINFLTAGIIRLLT